MLGGGQGKICQPQTLPLERPSARAPATKDTPFSDTWPAFWGFPTQLLSVLRPLCDILVYVRKGRLGVCKNGPACPEHQLWVSKPPWKDTRGLPLQLEFMVQKGFSAGGSQPKPSEVAFAVPRLFAEHLPWRVSAYLADGHMGIKLSTLEFAMGASIREEAIAGYAMILGNVAIWWHLAVVFQEPLVSAQNLRAMVRGIYMEPLAPERTSCSGSL